MIPLDDGPKDPFPDHALQLVLSVDGHTPAAARTCVREWLDTHQWPSEEAEDLVLAINEAVTNSVEHGYGYEPDDERRRLGQVEIVATVVFDVVGARCAEFVIRDFGRWQPPTAQPTTRGHGIPLMRRIADYVEVVRTPTGTSVLLRSGAVPLTDRSTR